MDGSGGAVYLRQDVENIVFSRCNFTENVADSNGGAIDAYTGVVQLTIEDCRFINNVAERFNGGGEMHVVAMR